MKSITGKRACALVELKGWRLKRIAGSHHIYVKEGSKLILSIPVHGSRDLRRGLQREIMKIAGIDESEL